MTTHVHDENCTFLTGSICGGYGRVYIARYRLPYEKKWTLIGKQHKTYGAAFKAMTTEFKKGHAKRADVLACDEWYEPMQLCELVRR